MRAKAIFSALLLAALAAPAGAQSNGGDAKGDKPADAGDKGKDGADGASKDGADGAGNGDKAAPAPESDGIDVDALRQQYLKLRDRLFRSRARAATVASAVFSTKLRVGLYYTTGRFYTVTRATIRLDGSSVFDDTEGVIAKDKAPRFEGWIAPGRHQIEIRIEAVGKDDERFKSVIQNSFTVQAVAGKDLVIVAKAKDSGNIPYKWKRKQYGTYKLRVDVDVDAVKRKAVKGKKKAAARRAKRSRVAHTSKTKRGKHVAATPKQRR